MRKLLFFLIFGSQFALSQGENKAEQKVSALFERYYNENKSDSVFSLFSAQMREALPFDKTKSFLDGMAAQAGKITKREFTGHEQSYAVYKTTFERAVFNLLISLDDEAQMNGLFIRPYKEHKSTTMERNVSKLILPFTEEWTVVWGGDTKELNYHVEHEAQKNAFDMVITDASGKSYQNDGTKNEDYYAFGKKLYAPCAGEVVLVVDGIKDNVPGVMNPVYVPGNTVIIKTANHEYLFFAHFKQHSIKVKQGQIVKQGVLLGLCGNSGNSSEAHLHFHIQNTENMNEATGIKCYFESLSVNGSVKNDYSPIQHEKIKRD